MKTNITTDNYEAYLLDYMENNLVPDETEQLKDFIAAQGLDWDELTGDLPRLEAPQIAYEGKESLKKSGAIVPLYVKIASAAAAAGLLLTVGLWPGKSMPEVERVAELSPILPSRLMTSEEIQALPPRTISFTKTQPVVRKQSKTTRTETTLLAHLQPLNSERTPVALTASTDKEPDFELIAYRMNSNLAFAQYDDSNTYVDIEDERDLSFIGKGIYLLTGGRHDSFASIITSGLSTAKQEISLAATDMALTAYHRAEEHVEGMKENRQGKREE